MFLKEKILKPRWEYVPAILGMIAFGYYQIRFYDSWLEFLLAWNPALLFLIYLTLLAIFIYFSIRLEPFFFSIGTYLGKTARTLFLIVFLFVGAPSIILFIFLVLPSFSQLIFYKWIIGYVLGVPVCEYADYLPHDWYFVDRDIHKCPSN